MNLSVQQRLPRKPLKHLDFHLHNTRQHVALNTIMFYSVSTGHQSADYPTQAVAGPGMKRHNTVLLGSDLDAWDETKEMRRDEARHLVPLAPIVPNKTTNVALVDLLSL